METKHNIIYDKLHYNAPVVLTFSIICVVLFGINYLTNNSLISLEKTSGS